MLTTLFLLALGPKLQVAEDNVEDAPKRFYPINNKTQQ